MQDETATPRLEVPRELARSHGSIRKDARADETALAALADLAAVRGVPDLGAESVLDVGCGVKFTQAIVNHRIPIGRYVGVDVYRPLVDFLRSAVQDPRFEFHHVDFYNERYNPDGARLGPDSRLPVPEGASDLICLYSVLTHLDDHDAQLMLRLLRRYVRPDGTLHFTVFLDELSSDGHGVMDHYARVFGEEIVGRVATYHDFVEGDPLRVALYERSYLVGLAEREGWVVERIDPPTTYTQFRVTCRPTG